MNQPLPSYGGQAVIEGVMMRGKYAVAIAMRNPEGEITMHTEALSPIYSSRFATTPFLRGLIILWDALGLGMRALTLSANVQTGEEEKLEGPALFLTLAVSILFALGLFFILPAGSAYLLEKGLEFLGVSSAQWIGIVLEGIVRILILIGYLVLVAKMEEINRVFAYHGAEHKTINAFEAGEVLTPENVAKHSLEHPRCGTAFLLTLVVFSILLFTIIGPMPLITRLVSRILLIPVLASVAYEYIRWTANHLDSTFVQWIIKPNLALQHLTTREPSLDMLEVSIASFNQMRADDQNQPIPL